jgi:hypothetical protein
MPALLAALLLSLASATSAGAQAAVVNAGPWRRFDMSSPYGQRRSEVYVAGDTLYEVEEFVDNTEPFRSRIAVPLVTIDSVYSGGEDGLARVPRNVVYYRANGPWLGVHFGVHPDCERVRSERLGAHTCTLTEWTSGGDNALGNFSRLFAPPGQGDALAAALNNAIADAKRRAKPAVREGIGYERVPVAAKKPRGTPEAPVVLEPPKESVIDFSRPSKPPSQDASRAVSPSPATPPAAAPAPVVRESPEVLRQRETLALVEEVRRLDPVDAYYELSDVADALGPNRLSSRDFNPDTERASLIDRIGHWVDVRYGGPYGNAVLDLVRQAQTGRAPERMVRGAVVREFLRDGLSDLLIEASGRADGPLDDDPNIAAHQRVERAAQPRNALFGLYRYGSKVSDMFMQQLGRAIGLLEQP